MTRVATAAARRAGDVLGGRYRLESQLGRGTTAVVWRARDERLDRPVAVKVPHADADGRAGADKLLAEARAMARLRHRHLAQVYDFGDDPRAATAYLVLEFVDGLAVSHALSEQLWLPWRHAVRVAAQVASALAAAHAQGVVHRDVAPGNVLVTEHGAKLVDFGTSAAPGSPEVGADGRIVGTPAYLAPERATGHAVAPAADVFALGVLLYRMLSGELPWQGDTPTALLVAPALRPPSPLPYVPGLPEAVETATLACLAADPELRPDAGSLASTLHGLVRSAQERAAPAAPVPVLTHAGR